MKMAGTVLALAMASALCVRADAPVSPYAGQQSRSIKALSAEDVESLLAGKGMGFAKAAELNGFPGPAHVLELATPLHLTDAQRKDTQRLFEAMQASAKAAGTALVEEERRLDALFHDHQVTRESLAGSLARIAELQARVRAAHLEAHLEQARILTAEQNAQYVALRGYDDSGSASTHGTHRH